MYITNYDKHLHEVLPTAIGAMLTPAFEDCQPFGWRQYTGCQEPGMGMYVTAYAFSDDGTDAGYTIATQITVAEWEAQQTAAAAAAAAAEALRIETPIRPDQPLETRLELKDGEDNDWDMIVDGIGLEILPVKRSEGSSRIAKQDYLNAITASLAARQTHRANMLLIKDDLDSVEASMDAVDVTNSGALGLAIAATSGVTKTALQECRTVFVAMKSALKNLRQAADKIRREIK